MGIIYLSTNNLSIHQWFVLAKVESQISRGDWVPEPGEDSLTAVLGREHPDRTRAVGHIVGLRKAMHGIDKKKRKMHGKESMGELRAKLDEVTKQVAELKAVIHDSRKQVMDSVSLRVHNSSSISMLTLAVITNPTQCKLVLPYGALDQNCATGLVFPYGDGLIHSLPLRENHMKVLIYQINKDFQSLPIPVVTGEVNNLQNAVGQIIQWPRNAIILTQIQGRKQQNLTPSLPPTSVGGSIRKNTLTPMNKSKPIELLPHDEILQLLNKRTLDVTILTVWEMNLHSIARVKNKCSFLNPHNILGESCQENPEAVINYIVDVMRIHQGKQFLIAPYLQRAFARYGKYTSNPISWMLVECNQQPGDWECGYYVMKWIMDFVMVEHNGFLSRVSVTPQNHEWRKRSGVEDIMYSISTV
ncbi:unnamed protein product [Lactuca saligna]|uniref:DUF8039 domain-containing protein n=1 Tax=Lactuca saligna TaxID=75948 RepID=A0AA35ZK07_LACSI|nr:unnamed protein product [Lactuca saligna]